MYFLDVVTRGEKGIEFRLEEFSVPEASNITEHTIGELKGEDGRHSTRYPHSRGQIRHDAGDRLRAGDTLIVLGSRGQIERLERLMRGEEIVEK